MTDKRYVFLSYGRKDVHTPGVTNAVEQEQHFPIVEKVYRHLYGLRDSTGLEPWFDKQCLTHDRAFTDSINQAIEQSDYMLLFIGKNSMSSEWCEREWKHALRHCVPIIPILLEGNWGDTDIQAIYPSRILSTNGINPQRMEGILDDNLLLSKIVSAIQQHPAPLAIPYNAKTLPAHYIERPQYLDDLKNRLGVNDINYKQRKNNVGITSRQETAALQGIGGIGKTTLARALCLDCEVRRAFDHIFWLDVGPQTSADDASNLMRIIGTNFGDSPDLYTDLQTSRSLVQKHLGGKRSLLVLDDVWAENLVDEFSWAGVDCRLVITTRNKSLVDNPQGITKLNTDEGLRLLATLFDTLNPDTTKLTDDHKSIVTTLDGYTLAIAIAGKWLNKYKQKSAGEYLARLRSGENELFKYLELSKSDKNSNLELSLSLSYNDLDVDDQKRFRALGMFASGSSFSQVALDTLWGTTDGFVEAQRLVDVGLLDVVKGNSDKDRYSQHSLLRAYVRALLTRAGEVDYLFACYADFYIHLADQFSQLPPEQWDMLDDDLPNIHQTGDELMKQTNTGQDGDLERAVAFAQNILEFVYQRRELHGTGWIEMGANAVQAFQSGSIFRTHYLKQEAIFLNELGIIFNFFGQKQRALDYFNRAVSIYGKAKNRHLKAITLNNIGQIWSDLGDKDQALEFFDEALKLHLKAGIKVENRHEKATVLNNIGGVWSDLGDNYKALDYYEKVLSIDREIGDKGGEATTLNNIGEAWHELGHIDKALDYYEQAFIISHEVGDKNGEIYTLNNIGSLYNVPSGAKTALKFYEQAIEIGKQTIALDLKILLYANIAHVYKNLGQLDKAISKLREVITFMKQYSLPYSEGGRSLEQYETLLKEWEAD